MSRASLHIFLVTVALLLASIGGIGFPDGPRPVVAGARVSDRPHGRSLWRPLPLGLVLGGWSEGCRLQSRRAPSRSPAGGGGYESFLRARLGATRGGCVY